MTVRWTFEVDSETYTFEINPNEGGTPSYSHNFMYQNTAGQNGKVLVFEGRDSPSEISWSGVILTEEQLTNLTTWFNKRNQILLTDDLGRQFWILIKSFTPKRVRSATNFWRHTYEMSATVVDWEPDV